MATPQQAAKDKQQVLSTLNSTHESRLAKSLENLEVDIISLLNGLTVSGGSIVSDTANLEFALQSRTDLVKLFNEDYTKDFIRPSVKEFDQTVRATDKYFKDTGIAINFTDVDASIIKELKRNSFDSLQALGVQTRIDLSNTIYNSTITGRNFNELVKDVKGVLTGLEDRRGVPMEVHANQITHDSLLSMDRSINVKKGNDAGITHYLYFGSVVANSRSICATHAGDIKTLEEWEEIWATQDWSGKSSSNFIEDAGGYNCGHFPTAVPNAA